MSWRRDFDRLGLHLTLGHNMNVILPCLDDGELLGQILKIIYDHNMGILASRRDGGNCSGSWWCLAGSGSEVRRKQQQCWRSNGGAVCVDDGRDKGEKGLFDGFRGGKAGLEFWVESGSNSGYGAGIRVSFCNIGQIRWPCNK